MKNNRCIGGLLLLGLGLALPAMAGRYETDHDADADFSSYASFAWHEVEPANEADRLARSDLVTRRARAAIVEQLASKGLEEAEPASADLLVEFHVQVRDRVDVDDTRVGRYSRDIIVDSYSAGTAIVDLIDREAGALVWRGWARDLIREGKTSEDRIRRGMARLFRAYPPGKD